MLLRTKAGLAVLLLLVFAANYAETAMESRVHVRTPVSAADNRAAYAMKQLEPEFINFEFHDQTARWAAYEYSLSYFFLLPIGGLAATVAFARRRELAPFRVFCLAVTVDYLISLPLFLAFPVPERWAYPGSNAMLLSDFWSSSLILWMRPISAINNCFPSTHTSLTVIIIAICWRFHFRLRYTVTALGLTVILATFVLGIHWLGDIVSGVVVGILSVDIARRFTDTSERRELALDSA
jgi:hypothetical protein